MSVGGCRTVGRLGTNELLVWLVEEDGVVGLAMSAMEGAMLLPSNSKYHI